MIVRDRSYRSGETIALSERFPEIMKILKNSTSPMSAHDIAKLYVSTPNSSDSLVTGTILNVLALAGVVQKTVFFKGKSNRSVYSLVGNIPESKIEEHPTQAIQSLFEMEKTHVLKTLEYFSGHKNRAASALGLTNFALEERLQVYELIKHKDQK